MQNNPQQSAKMAPIQELSPLGVRLFAEKRYGKEKAKNLSWEECGKITIQLDNIKKSKGTLSQEELAGFIEKQIEKRICKPMNDQSNENEQ